MKWKLASRVLCDLRVPTRLKGKSYKTAIRPAMTYGAECWPIKKQQMNKMDVVAMRILRRMCGNILERIKLEMSILENI